MASAEFRFPRPVDWYVTLFEFSQEFIESQPVFLDQLHHSYIDFCENLLRAFAGRGLDDGLAANFSFESDVLARQ